MGSKPARVLTSLKALVSSVINFKRSCSSCFCLEMSRTIAEAPMISPLAFLIGEMVTETGMILPLLLRRSVSRMPIGFAATDGGKDVEQFIPVVQREKPDDGTSDDFLRTVTKQAFRRRVPAHDDAVEVLAINGIFAGLDDGGEILHRAFRAFVQAAVSCRLQFAFQRRASRERFPFTM